MQSAESVGCGFGIGLVFFKLRLISRLLRNILLKLFRKVASAVFQSIKPRGLVFYNSFRRFNVETALALLYIQRIYLAACLVNAVAETGVLTFCLLEAFFCLGYFRFKRSFLLLKSRKLFRRSFFILYKRVSARLCVVDILLRRFDSLGAVLDIIFKNSYP